MDISKYLERKGLGYEHLSKEERKAISDFALVWSLFEAQLLDENGSSKKILEKCKDWSANEGIDEITIDKHLSYFQNRYIENNETNNKFEHLHFRKNDFPDLVKETLKGNTNDASSKLACCLIIILRFRNNYFHGIKWAYQFKDQQENFELSCALSTDCMDKYAY